MSETAAARKMGYKDPTSLVQLEAEHSDPKVLVVDRYLRILRANWTDLDRAAGKSRFTAGTRPDEPRSQLRKSLKDWLLEREGERDD